LRFLGAEENSQWRHHSRTSGQSSLNRKSIPTHDGSTKYLSPRQALSTIALAQSSVDSIGMLSILACRENEIKKQ